MKQSYQFITITFLLFISCLFSSHSNAQDGSLDPSFGTGGKVITSLIGTDEIIESAALQSDGKIVVAGYTDGIDFILFRYDSDGSLDSTFGTSGKTITDINGFNDFAYSVAVQSDGKIVVGGYSYNGINNDFALVRYKSDGLIDSSFGNNGKVISNIANLEDRCNAICIQSDGKIIAAGSSNNGTSTNFTLVRYNDDGSQDNTFGIGGIVTTRIDSNSGAWAITVQNDNKIIAAGNCSIVNGSNSDFAIARYNSDGSLDNTFGSGGFTTTDVGSISQNDIGYSIGIESDGKIVVGGSSSNGYNYHFGLVRYNSDGSLDNSFGSGGKVTTAFGSNVNDYDQGYEVNIQSDDKIILVGATYIFGRGSDFALARYNMNGNLDSTFGTGGKVNTDFRFTSDDGHSGLIQPDGKIIVAGWSYNGSDEDVAIARYNNLTLGISEIINQESGIIIYPNPFQNSFTLQMLNKKETEKSILVTDMLGNIVWQQQNNSNIETTIDISQHPKGIYFVKISQGDKVSTQKIVLM